MEVTVQCGVYFLTTEEKKQEQNKTNQSLAFSGFHFPK